MSNQLPEWLADYLVKRGAQRAEAVNAVLARLTERERALVKDAAVMGYVQGHRHPRDGGDLKDDAVLSLVVDACLAFPDLYPAVNAGPEKPAQVHVVDIDGTEPVLLRWGLNDVLWGDDDTVTVPLSGPQGEPYWLELDPERAAALRQDLAGSGGEQER